MVLHEKLNIFWDIVSHLVHLRISTCELWRYEVVILISCSVAECNESLVTPQGRGAPSKLPATFGQRNRHKWEIRWEIMSVSLSWVCPFQVCPFLLFQSRSFHFLLPPSLQFIRETQGVPRKWSSEISPDQFEQVINTRWGWGVEVSNYVPVVSGISSQNHSSCPLSSESHKTSDRRSLHLSTHLPFSSFKVSLQCSDDN
jgi:hypothetical protein